jgi:hypothetical protein
MTAPVAEKDRTIHPRQIKKDLGFTRIPTAPSYDQLVDRAYVMYWEKRAGR